MTLKPEALAAVSYTHLDVYKRQLERSLTRGPHGMPLRGSGDWKDGMNTVGNQGRGESVWLGWFLCDIIGRFAPVCEARGDTAFAKTILEYRAQLTDALNREAWDLSLIHI